MGKRIGRGNYGSVYVAKDKRNQRWYCLKMIMMEAHSDEERGAQKTRVAVLPVLQTLRTPSVGSQSRVYVCVVAASCPRRKGAAGGRGAPWP